MRYVVARFKEYQRDLAYRIYLTDTVYSAFHLTTRWYDVIKARTSRDTRSAEEIVGDIVAAGGLHFKGSETNDTIRATGETQS